MARDWRDERIAELETELAARDERLVAASARIRELEQQVDLLAAKVAELLERLGQNSRNSHRPPSSDPPAARQKRKGKKSEGKGQRKRGGQLGHRGAHRALVPADRVNDFIHLFPSECEMCASSLPRIPDALARRYQQIELPPLTPCIKEWVRHAVTCPDCGHATRAAYDATQIPASPFGPRVMALMALLTGVYHLSRRKASELLGDVVGVDVSLGALSAVEARVSEAVQPAVDEAYRDVLEAPVKHTDGTSWFQSGVALTLWTIATATATVFKIITDGSKKTLEPLYGALSGILVSDRAKALTFWAMENRQICWAHLLRKFVSFSERDGPAGTIGRELLDYSGILFEYWHDYRDGKLDRECFIVWMTPLRAQVEATLRRAVAANLRHVSGSCADILEHAAALWTFVDSPGVDPTNYHAYAARGISVVMPRPGLCRVGVATAAGRPHASLHRAADVFTDAA